nr:glucosyltransferase domain-containing protein [Ruegeria sp. HKCCSP351]
MSDDTRAPAWVLLLTAAVLAALLFLPTVGIGVVRSGFNPDEWRFAAGLERGFAEVHGRWSTHWAHEELFGWDTPIAFLIFVIFAALFGVSVLIARQSVARTGSIMMIAVIVVVFLAGSSHVYLTEILHYQTQAPWFSLGLMASVGAMTMIAQPHAQSVGGMVLRMIVAAELLAISIGFYQSYALMGFLIPAIVLIRIDGYDHRESVLCIFRVLVVSVVALALYQLQLRATISILDLRANFRFAGGVESTVILEKLSALHRMERLIHSGGLLGVPQPYRGVFLLGTAAVCGLVLMAALSALLAPRAFPGGGWFGAFRVFLGGFGALFILPVLIWFLYPEPYLIGRSIGFIGFVFAGVALASTAVVAQGMAGVPMSRFAPVAGLTLVLIFGVSQAIASSHIWPLFQRVAEQDVALADDIVERARSMNGFDITSTPIRSVGGPADQHLRFGGFQTPSTFHRGIDMNSIFQIRYGAANYAGSVLTPPRPCAAFPEDGSVFMAEGTLFVCFEATEPLPRQSTCFPLGGGRKAALCYSDTMAVLLGQTCADIDPGDGQIVATQLNEAGEWIRFNRFPWQALATEMNGLCYRFLSTGGEPFSVLRIEHKTAMGTEWTVEHDATDAQALEEILSTGNEVE